MSELTNWKREKRSKERIADVVAYVTHPIPCVDVQSHFSKAWNVSTKTAQIFTVAAVKAGKIARRAGWYVPVGKKNA